MVITNVFPKNEFNVRFAGVPFENDRNFCGYTLRHYANSKDSYGDSVDLAFNLALFNMPTKANYLNNCAYRTVTYLKAQDFEVGYGGCPERVMVNYKNIVGGIHASINNGKLNTGNYDTRPKNFAGITRYGSYVHVQSCNVTERVAVYTAMDYVKKMYQDEIVMLLLEDGGGSVGSFSRPANSLWAPLREGTDGRKIANAVLVTANRKNRITRSMSYRVGNSMEGEDVAFLQQMVGGVVIDGFYGKLMQARIKVVQENLHGKYTGKIDGSAGPQTLKAMGLWAN